MPTPRTSTSRRPRGRRLVSVPAGAAALALALATAPGCADEAPVGERVEELSREGDEPIEGIEEAAREVADEVDANDDPGAEEDAP